MEEIVHEEYPKICIIRFILLIPRVDEKDRKAVNIISKCLRGWNRIDKRRLIYDKDARNEERTNDDRTKRVRTMIGCERCKR